jgi:hypothetical protein
MPGIAELDQPGKEPLSPELVLVSPELRELALRELTATPVANGSAFPSGRPPPAATAAGHTPATTGMLLRGLARTIFRVTAFVAVTVALVAGAASVLTIAGGRSGPQLANRTEQPKPIRREWRSPGRAAPKSPPQVIGTADHDGPAVSPQSATDPAADGRNQPLGLTSYGRLVWNLDALLQNRFGNRSVCLRFAFSLLSPAACTAPPHQRSEYRAIFAAKKSAFRVRTLKRAPLLRSRAVPLKVGAGYVSCGPERWLAAAANWQLVCDEERRKRRP